MKNTNKKRRPRRGTIYIRSASTVYDRVKRINRLNRQKKDNDKGEKNA